jgi:hypothetical protein
MRIIGTSSNGGWQESVFYSNSNRGKCRGGKNLILRLTWKLAWWTSSNEGQLHGGGQGNFRGRGSHRGHGGSHQGQ